MLSPELQKSTGAHYTPSVLADFVASRMLKHFSFEKDVTNLKILDPATGDGALLCAILEKLSLNTDISVDVYGFDTDSEAINFAGSKIEIQYPDSKLHLSVNDFTEIVQGQDDLFSEKNKYLTDELLFDLVIANPPYVRTQILGGERSQELAKIFQLTGRIDLYFAFIIGISRVMKIGGITGIIVSNRVLTTKAAGGVRDFLLRNFDILHIYDLGDTKLFSAAVLPSVLILRKKSTNLETVQAKFTSVYENTFSKNAPPIFNIFEAIDKKGDFNLQNTTFKIDHGWLESSKLFSSVWHLSNNNTNDWLLSVSLNTDTFFGKIGDIKVGVKTCADKVFIRNDWDELDSEKPESELLLPVITHHVAGQFIASEPPIFKILYPYDLNNARKKLLNLKAFPKTARYFEKHRDILSKRDYLMKSNREWYEIWVPHTPSKWKDDKIVFREISSTPTFWLDRKGYIVNGDCYWIQLFPEINPDFFWLMLAVANSSFIEKFYDMKFNNKLYSGRRRFLTQYVEKFPLPDISKSKEIINLSKHIYQNKEEKSTVIEKLNNLVHHAFGLDVED